MKRQILDILSAVGERGISVSMLAKNVYNQQCTLFYTPDYDEIRTQVGQFLWRNSQSPKSLISHADRRGYYKLNTAGSVDARQLMLDFKNSHQETEPEMDAPKSSPDLSLSLFD